jgi:hypothetical protein
MNEIKDQVDLNICEEIWNRMEDRMWEEIHEQIDANAWDQVADEMIVYEETFRKIFEQLYGQLKNERN